MENDQAQFCPKCGAASIDSSALAGGHASCTSCFWGGSTTELITHNFKHDLGSNQEVMAAFMSDFKQFMSSSVALPLAKVLMKWGFFVGSTPTPQELARYIKAVAFASVGALLEERRAIEKERVGHGN